MSLLVATNLHRSFGGVIAIAGVTFEIAEGKITALIGPNGAGKTTLFNVLSGTMIATSGTTTFRGEDITGWPAHRVAELGIARTFQNLELFGEMTVRQNVLVGRQRLMRSGLLAAALRLPRQRRDERQHRRAVDELLSRVGLGDVADWPATALSYGLQRRVELARALAAEPALLLLDEPLAGLATSEAVDIVRLIRRLVTDGLTVLLVEHHMAAVMGLSDEVLVLDQGKLIAQGPPAAVQIDPAVIAAYLGQEL